jgi:hypothetical protein
MTAEHDPNPSLKPGLEAQARKVGQRALKAKLARGAAQADRSEFVDPADLLKKIDARKNRRATSGKR